MKEKKERNSELILSVVFAIISIGISMGYVTAEEGETLSGAAVIIVGLLVSGAAVINYAYGRAKMKTGSNLTVINNHPEPKE